MNVLRTVRARATAGAAAIFAVALLIAAAALMLVLRSTMLENVDTAVTLRADDITTLLVGGTAPDELAIDDDDDSLIQVINNGAVVASSANIASEPPLASFDTTGSEALFTAEDLPIEGTPFRVLTRRVATPGGEVILMVGQTVQDVSETLEVVSISLAIGLPLLLALAAGTTWRVVGRALEPVESLRSEVAEIGATDLHQRVSEPSTDDEIRRLADTMNAMLDRIEDGSVRQRRFVSDASHELRTPISIIRHELEVALRHSDTANWSTVASEVLEENLRMQRLVDDLLWLARNEAPENTNGSAPSRRALGELVDLDEVARRLGRRVALGSTVTVDTSSIGAGQVRGNEDDLGRVVQNLVDNATRHASAMVRVTTTSSQGKVYLHVDDDGPGVPASQRSVIFERFTRGDEARSRDDGGAGLGLAIAAEIAEHHHGVLSVGESPLGGARFTLELNDAREA